MRYANSWCFTALNGLANQEARLYRIDKRPVVEASRNMYHDIFEMCKKFKKGVLHGVFDKTSDRKANKILDKLKSYP